MTKTIQTIFLVDDDLDDQLLFQEALSEANDSINFLSACNGIEALEELHQLDVLPCVVFMDVNMPKMNGIDCLKELKKSDRLKLLPVVMYSTSCTLDFQKECFENGAANYIEKPYDFWELCNLIRQILANGITAKYNKLPI